MPECDFSLWVVGQRGSRYPLNNSSRLSVMTGWWDAISEVATHFGFTIYENQVGGELEASSMVVNFYGPKAVMQSSRGERHQFSFPALNPGIVRPTCQASCSHLYSHDAAVMGANQSLFDWIWSLLRKKKSDMYYKPWFLKSLYIYVHVCNKN